MPRQARRSVPKRRFIVIEIESNPWGHYDLSATLRMMLVTQTEAIEVTPPRLSLRSLGSRLSMRPTQLITGTKNHRRDRLVLT